MKFTRDSTDAVTVRQFDGASITIGDRRYCRTIALTPAGVLGETAWPRVTELAIDDLAPLLDAGPELVLVGTGRNARRTPRELMFAMARRGTGIEIMDTAAACRTFNILVGEGRRVAALLAID